MAGQHLNTTRLPSHDLEPRKSLKIQYVIPQVLPKTEDQFFLIREIICELGLLVFRNFSQPNRDLQFGSITPPIDSKLGMVTPLLICQTSALIR